MKQRLIIRRNDQQNSGRIYAKFIETSRTNMPGTFLHRFATQPEQRLALSGAQPQERGEAGAAADIVRLHEQFMQASARKSTAQSIVDRVMTQRETVRRRRCTAGFQLFQLPFQAG